MSLWRRKHRVPDDIDEAETMRENALEQMGDAARVRAEHEKRAPRLLFISNGLIERLPQNHFVESLYPYPKGLR